MTKHTEKKFWNCKPFYLIMGKILLVIVMTWVLPTFGQTKSNEHFPYTRQLTAFKEPLLTADSSQSEIYRFTWLRTFHHPIAVRIEKHNNASNLYWKVTDGMGGYAPGKLIADKQKTISKETWNKFNYLLKQLNFWHMKKDSTELPVSDGAQWVLEGKSVNKYHFVDIQNPGISNSYHKCCYFLVGLTDLKIKDSEKY